MKLRKLLRTILVYCPTLHNAKLFIQRSYLKYSSDSFDSDFNALKLFKFDREVLLDIGGNNGFAIDAMLGFCPNCEIHSFEPNPSLAGKNQRRFKSLNNVSVYNLGLGDQFGDFILYSPVYNGYEFSGLASLSREEASSWLNESLLYFYSRERLTLKEYTCTIKKLDDFNFKPSFIKIDVQGYELNVLKGGKNTISEFKPVILIENSSQDEPILNYLSKFGYRQYAFEENKLILDKKGKNNSFYITEETLRKVSPNAVVVK